MNNYKIVNGFRHIRYDGVNYNTDQMDSKVNDFYQCLQKRRSIRDFSNKDVSVQIIEKLILTAATAPSGAHKQPWTFCAVSNPELKSQIRKAAEKEEKDNYEHRMSERWKLDLTPLGTDTNKPFLESAPWLIIIFRKIFEYDEDKVKHNNYYVNESVGIACGMLLAAIHYAGLVSLTHTPSPMNFLIQLLKRPSNERPYLICPVGYPEQPTFVPDLKRKSLEEISTFYS